MLKSDILLKIKLSLTKKLKQKFSVIFYLEVLIFPKTRPPP